MSRRVFMLCAALLFSTASTTFAADASVGVDFGTSYIFRGATLNDSWVMQPYLEVSGIPKVEGLTLGTWGNLDLASGAGGVPESGEFSEIDYYFSYDLPIQSDLVGLSVGYIEYLYPGSDGESDREINAVLSLDTPLSPSFGIYGGVDGAIEEALYLELGVGHNIEVSDEVSLSLGGTAAYLVQAKDSTADDGFSYVMVSAGLSYSFVQATVNYYIETDDKVLEIDEDVQGILGIFVDF